MSRSAIYALALENGYRARVAAAREAAAWQEACSDQVDQPQDCQRLFPDNSIYEGQFRHGQPDGFGRMDWPKGRCYLGNWRRGLPHGRGIMIAVGDAEWLYSGQFAGGQRHGNGRCEWSNHNMWYDGDWENGLQHGIGEYGASHKGTPEYFRFDQGDRKESLALSSYAPAAHENLPTVVLDRKYTTLLKSIDSQPDEVEVVLETWGFAVGNPEAWFCGDLGGLMVTRVFSEGPLSNFHEGQLGEAAGAEEDQEAIIVLPNSWIWKVDEVQGNGYEMLQVLMDPRRQKVAMQIRLPPHTRVQNIRRNLPKRRRPFQPTPYEHTGYRPWLETWAKKEETDLSFPEFSLVKQHLQLMPPKPEESIMCLSRSQSSFQVTEPALPSLSRLGDPAKPRPRLVAAIRTNEFSTTASSMLGIAAGPRTVPRAGGQKTDYWRHHQSLREDDVAAKRASYW